MPVTNIARVESMNGAPRMAPTPISRATPPAGEQDRDDRDHRLGQRGPDRREHGPDRPLGEAQLLPEPLDAVGEELGAEEDHDEGDRQDEQVHGQASNREAIRRSPIAMTRGARGRSTRPVRRGGR